MTEHISTTKMELFSARGLPEAELSTIARHLAKCSDCHQQLVASLRWQRGVAALSFTLAPEFWLRHEHIEYEQLVELAEDKLDATDREVIDFHLKACTRCKEDVRSFLAFREGIAPELEVSNAPIGQEHRRPQLSWMEWWRSLAWKPAYTAAVVLLGIAVVIGVALLFRRPQNLRTQQVAIPTFSPSSVPDDRIVGAPSPSLSPPESPEPVKGEAVVTLNDRGGTISVDRVGNVTGLADVPAATRNEIAKMLLSERIEASAVLKELGGQDATLRGSQDAQPFKLLSPSRTVIASNRPTLKWEKAAGATSYKVYVNDEAGNEVAKSQELSSDLDYWNLPMPLKRGEIYNWTVVAVVDEKEIVSPGPSASEMKFQVLSMSNLQQLRQLKKTGSHLALGVFYSKVGMIDAGKREFQSLVRLNPKSVAAKNLLHSAARLR